MIDLRRYFETVRAIEEECEMGDGSAMSMELELEELRKEVSLLRRAVVSAEELAEALNPLIEIDWARVGRLRGRFRYDYTAWRHRTEQV